MEETEIRIILASKSPRRRELLQRCGLNDFLVITAEIDESAYLCSDPVETVKRISREKALAVQNDCAAEDIIIAADTVVYLSGTMLGKPADREEAFSMLRMLSGQKHTVYTGVTILCGNRSLSRTEATDVYFRPMSDAEIDAYINTGEPMDKAGAYGIQGPACIFIHRIEGDFFNVMGLPMATLSDMLSEFHVSLLSQQGELL